MLRGAPGPITSPPKPFKNTPATRETTHLRTRRPRTKVEENKNKSGVHWQRAAIVKVSSKRHQTQLLHCFCLLQEWPSTVLVLDLSTMPIKVSESNGSSGTENAIFLHSRSNCCRQCTPAAVEMVCCLAPGPRRAIYANSNVTLIKL